MFASSMKNAIIFFKNDPVISGKHSAFKTMSFLACALLVPLTYSPREIVKQSSVPKNSEKTMSHVSVMTRQYLGDCTLRAMCSSIPQ